MAIIECPECDAEVSDSAPTCPNCGGTVRDWRHGPLTAAGQQEQKNSGVLAIVSRLMWGGLVVIVGPGLLFYVLSGTSKPDSEKTYSDSPTRIEAPAPIIDEGSTTKANADEMQTGASSSTELYTPVQSTDSQQADPALATEATPEETQHAYTILNDHASSYKRSVDVRLQKRVTASALETIAHEIKRSGPSAPNIFIVYYLPGVRPGSGGWATSHFTPDLTVNIQGETAEESQEAEQVEKTADRDVYRDSRPYAPKRVWIEKSGGRHAVVQVQYDDSRGRTNVRRSTRGGVEYYHPVEATGTGDHWRKPNGQPLEVWDNQGLISKYERVD